METYQDYLFLLQPSDTVKHQIRQCKLKASAYIGNYPGMKGTAHISLFNTHRQKPHVIGSFIEMLRRRIESMPPVTLDLEGFQFFVHGEKSVTIYARIKPSYRSDNWFELLKKQLRTKNELIPHITVTKAISYDSFFKLWPELRSVNYADTFTVNELTILARESLNPNTSYRILEKIPFKNQLSA